VAVSGDTIVVGAFLEDSSQATITNGATASTNNSAYRAGAAYVFSQTATTWAAQAYLKAPNAGSKDYFGTAVAVSGDTIVVGAYLEDSSLTTISNGPTASTNNSASGAGAAYVFSRTGTTWAAQAYLKAPNAGSGDYFGLAVAVSGDTIVVGARGEASSQTTITNGATASTNNSVSEAGAAYVFVSPVSPGVCSSSTRWDPARSVCVATLGGIIDACKKERGKWSFTCSKESHETTTTTTTGSGPTQIGDRAPFCDSQSTVYDEQQSQCVASYIKSARSCIEGSLVGSTNGRVSCGQVSYPPPPTTTDY